MRGKGSVADRIAGIGKTAGSNPSTVTSSFDRSQAIGKPATGGTDAGTASAPAQTKALHPSWEAARLRKAKQQLPGQAIIPAGKKIVFD